MFSKMMSENGGGVRGGGLGLVVALFLLVLTMPSWANPCEYSNAYGDPMLEEEAGEGIFEEAPCGGDGDVGDVGGVGGVEDADFRKIDEEEAQKDAARILEILKEKLWKDDSPPPSPWYFSFGLGYRFGFRGSKVGWNRDTICYPNDPCFGQGGLHDIEGYRWFYDIDARAGASNEGALGARLGERLRAEFFFEAQEGDAHSHFKHIEYLDGSDTVINPESPIETVSRASARSWRGQTLGINGYYDIPNATPVTPFVGVGIGATFHEVSDESFNITYHAEDETPYDPPGLSFYESNYEGRTRGWALSKMLYFGANYALGDQMMLGLKITHSRRGDFEDGEKKYSQHPMNSVDPDFKFHETYSNIGGGWAWKFVIGRYFGGKD